MILGRRVKPGWRQNLRSFFWPESGPRRAAKYLLKRVCRMRASPHAIAAGFAAGAAASFTPFLGFHFVIGMVLAWFARGNLVAAVIGTAVGNPLTFPLIFASTYETGHFILGLVETQVPAAGGAGNHGQAVIAEGFFKTGFEGLWPVVKTMAIGSVPLGIVAFLVFYVLVRSVATGFQRARQARQARRTAARASANRTARDAGQTKDANAASATGSGSAPDDAGTGRNPLDRAPA